MKEKDLLTNSEIHIPLLWSLEKKNLKRILNRVCVTDENNLCDTVALLVTVGQAALPSRTWQFLSAVFHEL